MKRLDKTALGIIHFGRDEHLYQLLNTIPKDFLPSTTILNHNPEQTIKTPNCLIIHSPDNPGYGQGMNKLMKLALSKGFEHFVGLNNDLQLKENAIETLTQNLQQEQLVAVQGVLLNPKDEILTARTKLNHNYHWTYSIDRHKPWSAFISKGNLKTTFICGAFFAVNLKALELKNIFFDEDFFLYHEDIEWSWRLSNLKIPLYVVTDAAAVHLESAASGGKITWRGIKYRRDSLTIYLNKTKRNLCFKFLSWFAFWLRMIYCWQKYGFR